MVKSFYNSTCLSTVTFHISENSHAENDTSNKRETD